MYLKRGTKRRSCDFCFQRKVKCDRLSRPEGQNKCSHCELRELPCVKESTAVRSTSTSIPSEPGSGRTIDDSSQAPTSPTRPIIENNNISPPVSAPVQRHTSSDLPSSSSTEAVPTGFEWQDLDWDLGADSISFLDSIFSHAYNFDNIPDTSDIEFCGQPETSTSCQSPYEVSGLELTILDQAIKAYFDLAWLALPILSRDAFMADYKNDKASPTLVYAVACRGCPFVSTVDKWTIQEKLAGHLRQRFLEARLAAESEHSVRLDDLEALALMIDFPYGPSQDVTATLHSRLGKLFLTHDSLLLMTLQYQILGHSLLPGGSSEPLQGAEDRKRLLLWHVYGTDAFRTLDTKMPSRIRDINMETTEQPTHDERTYLDSILALAIIAKKIHQNFPGSSKEEIATHHDDTTKLYDQLAEWRNTLPSHLQSSREGKTSYVQDDLMETSRTHFLQQTVLRFLEHNCYMQIQACASRSGVDDDQSLEAIMLDHLFEYRTLEAAKSIIEELPRLQLKIYHKTPTGVIGYPLIDLVPNILRDICAGTCRWMIIYGKKLLSCDMRKGAEYFVIEATKIRDAVATARSHVDTRIMVENLDEDLALLKQMIRDAEES
ncbi:Zn(2)-C6 fungal-type DNA-binding domain protein [Fusarium beomiforme]|uniref:Zn(2)-C6 fungal-type DNA-binding domain protein n=1 Tax=Fusarium beomiforme TaxID=44412 RepID=A0A9P5AU91_9HYPO|nr:Zn(2)-C6 fungal-type DNA-binding domain protein [Fusarium beomiforme]